MGNRMRFRRKPKPVVRPYSLGTCDVCGADAVRNIVKPNSHVRLCADHLPEDVARSTIEITKF